MSGKTPPEITLELSGGSLTIRAAEAIYHIIVTSTAASQTQALPAGSPPPPALPPQQEAAPQQGDDDWEELDLTLPDEEQGAAEPDRVEAAAGAPDDEEYYRELSHDMYREVGRLARRLSMSIRDVDVPKVDGLDLQEAGDQLEEAKDQLESVVKMTEQATLKIMDLGEEIQNAIDKARGVMERMQVDDGEAEGEDGDQEAVKEAREQLAQALEAVEQYLAKAGEDPLAGLEQKVEELKAELAKAGEQAPEPAEEPAPQGPRYEFPMDLVFQTTYELCTNEAVKKHIKAMWDSGAKGFDAKVLEDAINAAVKEPPDEDNFLNVPLKAVLKALFDAAKVDKFKQVLKKMASTADQIFLDQFLPMEATPAKEQPAAPAKPAPAPAGPPPELAAKLDELLGEIKKARQELAPPQLPAGLKELLDKALASGGAGRSSISAEMHRELEESLGMVFTAVNSIIEALSFQDLSGQAIYKIVRLLTDFQVQLLAMVVSFGTKIKTKEMKKEVTVDESEEMAQQEVDKVLSTLGVADEEEGPQKLDQESVNALLESMGF